MKLAALFLVLSSCAVSGMHKMNVINAPAQRNSVSFTIANQALIKSLADRKLRTQASLEKDKQTNSCFIIHKKAGMFNKFDSTSLYYSFAFKEKINSLHTQKNFSCDLCGPDSILDDKEYVQIRSIAHADESTKWQDYC